MTHRETAHRSAKSTPDIAGTLKGKRNGFAIGPAPPLRPVKSHYVLYELAPNLQLALCGRPTRFRLRHRAHIPRRARLDRPLPPSRRRRYETPGLSESVRDRRGTGHYGRLPSDEIPCIFPDKQGKGRETGSLKTDRTAKQCLSSRALVHVCGGAKEPTFAG